MFMHRFYYSAAPPPSASRPPPQLRYGGEVLRYFGFIPALINNINIHFEFVLVGVIGAALGCQEMSGFWALFIFLGMSTNVNILGQFKNKHQ
jgi:hypothetical protein